ncbi:probable E3 ubiquitin-protein ligase ARI9 [Trichoderma asperellum]|uniref:RBR-type E3 ubiquitin transferase n=1 Tax=Trichoderma asperellum TaxID=101201 RepID=A0A6V8QUI6_TRIAP|nr:probable E3 ubiquitin-protein ligase ARI9 [Trichoderma asperellum]
MTTSTVELHALTSASLGPDDSITLYENPYTALDKLQDASKDKEIESSGDVNSVDWRKYEPPAALRKAPTIKSQILLDIIFSSIENVKTRVEEEERLLKEATEEAERRTAEEKHKAKGKEPYLPVIIPIEDSPAESSSNINAKRAVTPRAASDFMMSGGNGLPVKGEKRRKFGLRNIFQRSPEGGETSAAGRSREALRHKLEAKILSLDAKSADPKTQEAIAALRKSKLFKTVDPDELVECVSCLDDIPVKDTVKVPCHSYCRDCFARLISAAVQNEQQWPPKCCLNQIPFKTVLRNIPDDLKKTFHEKSSEWELPISERVYCYAPDCGIWIKPGKISLAKRQARCERNHVTCTICRGQAHGNNDCPQDHDLNLTNLLAEEEGWKHCISCHALVEHKEACQHMTCRCGAEFCYVCGLRWRTCGCTMEQLHAIKEAAEARREQRLLNEQADAEELRDILAQIEEFERQEALRLEAERLEQERLEQERWRAVVVERLRLENIRRQDVEIKYRQLRDILDDLHELQHVMADSRQEDDARDLATEAELQKKQLKEKHQAEREDLDSSMQAKLRAREDQYEKEYAARVALERQLENDYLQQLREFWSDKDGGEERIEASMQPLRQRMDSAYQAWQRWKDDQLAHYRDRLEDERTVKEEFMYSSSKRMDAAYLDKEAELARRIVAEKEWIQEVMQERERLLSVMEAQETEDDADSLYGLELDG